MEELDVPVNIFLLDSRRMNGGRLRNEKGWKVIYLHISERVQPRLGPPSPSVQPAKILLLATTMQKGSAARARPGINLHHPARPLAQPLVVRNKIVSTAYWLILIDHLTNLRHSFSRTMGNKSQDDAFFPARIPLIPEIPCPHNKNFQPG